MKWQKRCLCLPKRTNCPAPVSVRMVHLPGKPFVNLIASAVPTGNVTMSSANGVSLFVERITRSDGVGDANSFIIHHATALAPLVPIASNAGTHSCLDDMCTYSQSRHRRLSPVRSEWNCSLEGAVEPVEKCFGQLCNRFPIVVWLLEFRDEIS